MRHVKCTFNKRELHVSIVIVGIRHASEDRNYLSQTESRLLTLHVSLTNPDCSLKATLYSIQMSLSACARRHALANPRYVVTASMP
jgi:hypothetical protein